MSFWQILGRFAVSDTGETLQKLLATTSVSSDGTTYTKMGSTTVRSEGSVFTQMGSTATGIGAVFNDRSHIGNEWPSAFRIEKDQF